MGGCDARTKTRVSSGRDGPSSSNGHEGVTSVESQSKTMKPIEIDTEYARIPIAFAGNAGYIIGGDGNKFDGGK